MASLLLFQKHKQLQNLRIIRMQPKQILEAPPGCLGLAIATLQVRFEQGEFARRGAVRQSGLQHHFGLLQAFQCNQAFQQQAPICLAEVVLVLELMHQPGVSPLHGFPGPLRQLRSNRPVQLQ